MRSKRQKVNVKAGVGGEDGLQGGGDSLVGSAQLRQGRRPGRGTSCGLLTSVFRVIKGLRARIMGG